MLARLAVILALLTQQLALPMMIGGERVAACAAGSCCRIVESTSCCGEVTREMRCGRTGGECLCALEPCDSRPAPDAPLPQDGADAGLLFTVIAAHAIPPHATGRARLSPAPPNACRSHNEARALLCIWRT